MSAHTGRIRISEKLKDVEIFLTLKRLEGVQYNLAQLLINAALTASLFDHHNPLSCRLSARSPLHAKSQNNNLISPLHIDNGSCDRGGDKIHTR